MTAGQWRVTILLVVVALAFSFFLSLDAGHAIVLVTAAFAAGVVNGVLDNLDADRLPAPSTPPRSKGLAEVQALEFSLSGARTGVGVRAINQLGDVASAALRARRLDPHTVGGPLAALLAVYRGTGASVPVDAQSFDAAMDQLEQILRTEPFPVSGSSQAFRPAKDNT